jgi:hypothetical protein
LNWKCRRYAEDAGAMIRQCVLVREFAQRDAILISLAALIAQHLRGIPKAGGLRYLKPPIHQASPTVEVKRIQLQHVNTHSLLCSNSPANRTTIWSMQVRTGDGFGPRFARFWQVNVPLQPVQ